ncbi:hypothetical protein GCM10011574_42100 [Microbispora bryophytorum]|uniref:Uncharacterized protein n=1 Tax=Microbispora bryophytorum TaxID=1460882 RepID=A0A8H9H0Q2_9ACTN|nr:hypothetical protein GCM10011574_42100 [Microbispora bryophytorum]
MCKAGQAGKGKEHVFSTGPGWVRSHNITAAACADALQGRDVKNGADMQEWKHGGLLQLDSAAILR